MTHMHLEEIFYFEFEKSLNDAPSLFHSNSALLSQTQI